MGKSESTSEKELIQKALQQAEQWQNRANQLLTSEERQHQKIMLDLLNRPVDKVILNDLFDQSFRSQDAKRVVDQFIYQLTRKGIPQFFSTIDQLLLRAFLLGGKYAPTLSVTEIKKKIRKDTQNMILPEEDHLLRLHLTRRKDQGVRVNLNHLGEVVLGEKESEKRLQHYVESLRDPEIEHISIKISSIYSQLHPLGYEHSLEVLQERLTILLREARDHHYVPPTGEARPKLVNIDMEEYRDLELTLEMFTKVLDQPEFDELPAGIVLQAYIPDSYLHQQNLTQWAQERVAQGRSPIKLRIVKGANLQMEMVESELKNWPLPIYDSKIEVDANYKRMVQFGMKPENIQAVPLGIASHNLFDLAYAWILAQEYGVESYFTFEMLEGMADHLRRAIMEENRDFLLYTPVVKEDQFLNAIAYLMRRLDENTGADNFLRHSFGMQVNSQEWYFLKEQFLASFEWIPPLNDQPRRRQNRHTETFSEKTSCFHTGVFTNEPDTDWSLPQNLKWAESIRRQWQKTSEDTPFDIPLWVGRKKITTKRKQEAFFDLSQPDVCVCVVKTTNTSDVKAAVRLAKEDPTDWRKKKLKHRHQLLTKAAMELRKSRGNLIGIAAAVAGKTFFEADVEVSEAIDFAEFYPHSLKTFDQMPHLKMQPKGVGLVIPPWNFPIAIPAGGIIAALAAGNTVILKPAFRAYPVAWELVQCFWKAGIPQEVLQILPCTGPTTSLLAQHPDIDFIIFTGGTDTAFHIFQSHPEREISAETGGKNATIVTAMSDRDEAVGNVVYSAFGHGGQKCSATSLLILEKEIYNDQTFRKQLVDAIESLRVGSVWDFSNEMGPLFLPPEGALKKGFSELEPGERWIIPPENIHDNARMWRPALKWGVKPGSYSHKTEFFGPLLSVMCAADLEEAIEIANTTGYGLTTGLESLDTREHELWKEKIFAGNLYINRVTTGAIVLRQPFGGVGLSAIGPGIKAGSPNYAIQFMKLETTKTSPFGAISQLSPLQKLAQRWQGQLQRGEWPEHHQDLEKSIQAVHSYLYQMEQEFSKEHDFFHLRGQDNVFRYLPIGKVVVRLHPKDSLFDALARIAGTLISGCQLEVSYPLDLKNAVIAFLQSAEGQSLLGTTPWVHETDDELVKRFDHIDRLRYADPQRVPTSIYRAAAEKGMYIARNTPLVEGRLELLQYMREQSISTNYHRYGNLGERDL